MKEANRIYAWVAVDAVGEEGIVAIPLNGCPWPLTFVSERLARSVANEAAKVAEHRKAPVRLVEYVRGKTLDVVNP